MKIRIKIMSNSSDIQNGFQRGFYDLEETCDFLCTSRSTYRRHEQKGLAPQGKKLFGRKKLYAIGEVNLFAEGKWKPEEWITQEVQK